MKDSEEIGLDTFDLSCHKGAVAAALSDHILSWEESLLKQTSSSLRGFVHLPQALFTVMRM